MTIRSFPLWWTSFFLTIFGCHLIQAEEAKVANECIAGDILSPRLDKGCACAVVNLCLSTKEFNLLLKSKDFPETGRNLGENLVSGISNLATGKKGDFSDIANKITSDSWKTDISFMLDKVKRHENELDLILRDRLYGNWDLASQRLEFVVDFKNVLKLIEGEKSFDFKLITHFTIDEIFESLATDPLIKEWLVKKNNFEMSKLPKTSTPSAQ